MREITRRLVGFTTGLALAVGLVACGGASKPAAPTNAEELVAAFEAKADKDNYHSEGTIGMSINLFGADMPMKGDITSDCAGTTSHTVMNMSGKVMEESLTSTIDGYIAPDDGAYFVYSRTSTGEDEGTWTKSETDEDTSIHSSLLSAKDMKNAEFAATETGYTLTLSTADVDELLKSFSTDPDEILDSLGNQFAATPIDDTSVVYTFDKDCYPTNVTLKAGYNFAYAGEKIEGLDLSSMTMGITIDLNLDFSGYGTIDEASVTVPADVKASAVEEVEEEPSDEAPAETDQATDQTTENAA